MIFVTVGTHEQQFDRLLREIDMLKERGMISEEVVMQTGFSNYEPQFCQWSKLLPYNEMERLVREARIVVTHGGPSSFIMPLQHGKVPVVVPRQKQYDEHVNDHQLEFARAVAERQGNIIVVEDIAEMVAVLRDYDDLVSDMNRGMQSNNARFCAKVERMVAELLEE